MAKNKKAKKPAPAAKKKAKPASAVKKGAQKAVQRSANKKAPLVKSKAAAKVKKATAMKAVAKKSVEKKRAPKKLRAPQVTAKKTIPAKFSSSKAGKIDFAQFVSPLEDRLFVEVQNQREKKTAGGLYIPDTVSVSEAYLEGHVLAAGPGRRNKRGQLRPLDVRVGDHVLFPQYAGTLLELEQRHFYFLSEEQILGVKK